MEDGKFSGFFNNYKFYVDPDTNELITKFVCEDCDKIMTKEEMLNGHYRISNNYNGPLHYHTAKFWCRECAVKRFK